MIRLAGVTASDSTRNMSESIPVVRMAKLTGLAPSRPPQASQPRRMTGTVQLSRTTDLVNRSTFMVPARLSRGKRGRET